VILPGSASSACHEPVEWSKGVRLVSRLCPNSSGEKRKGEGEKEEYRFRAWSPEIQWFRP